MEQNLKDSLCYLAGPIEDVEDNGVEWRKRFINKSSSMKIRFIDPCDKPANCTQEIDKIGGDQRKVDLYRKNRQFKELQKFVKKFRREDLRFVDISDFLVVYIDPDVHMCGSYDELITAERQRKPIFAIVKGGIDRLPTWLFGVFELEHVFPTVEDCVNYLYDIHEGIKPMDDRWLLIRKYLDA